MDLVQVDFVHAQQTEAALGGPQHSLPAQVAAQHFGGNEYLIADADDGLAYRVFGAVHLRRVD